MFSISFWMRRGIEASDIGDRRRGAEQRHPPAVTFQRVRSVTRTSCSPPPGRGDGCIDTYSSNSPDASCARTASVWSRSAGSIIATKGSPTRSSGVSSNTAAYSRLPATPWPSRSNNDHATGACSNASARSCASILRSTPTGALWPTGAAGCGTARGVPAGASRRGASAAGDGGDDADGARRRALAVSSPSR